MTYNYLPDDELNNDSKLNGIFKVSFEIKVESHDELSLSDLTHDLAEGLERGFGNGFIERVAALNVEKLTKKAVAKKINVGDKIRLISDVKLEADIYSDDGYVFIGNPNEISEKLTTEKVAIDVTTGAIGFINRIHKDGSLEIADIDKPYTNDKWVELGIDAVNLDLITVTAEQIEKIDSDEVK